MELITEKVFVFIMEWKCAPSPDGQLESTEITEQLSLPRTGHSVLWHFANAFLA